MIRITEEWKAKTRRKTFYYVREGKVLRHISKYATEKTTESDKNSYKVNYKIPIETLQEKIIYEFGFTNKGGFGVFKFMSIELLKEKPEKEMVHSSELLELEFEIESDEVRKWLNEVKEIYTPLLDEISEFMKRNGMEHILTSERVGDYLNSMKIGLLSNLCNWPEKSRIRSIQQTTKLLHQVWTLKIFHDAVGCMEFEKKWLLEMGSESPATIFTDKKRRYWTCWWEPRKIKEVPPTYKGPLCKMFEGKVVWKRPDILVSQGKYEKLTDTQKFDILIECKNLNFQEWWENGKVITKQLSPYLQLFEPRIFVLVSLKPVPDWAKDELSEKNIVVIDEFHSNGRGISRFYELINSCF